ncbi:hypothetical protein [Aquiflexum gelatinilyticum]|nr:hypothetical protein [Aquiflexum gelatinilyticum]MCS4433014.1 hypothetical protein [Aquiflexum gelatinilyticum]
MVRPVTKKARSVTSDETTVSKKATRVENEVDGVLQKYPPPLGITSEE